MSKLQLKKELQRLTKEQLIEQITELYDIYKPVKEYYKTRLNPDGIQELYEKYKAVIIDKFHPGKMMRNLRTCFPVARKAIADFSALKPPPRLLADLMVTLAEKACSSSDDYGDMPEQFYTNASNSFERALKYLKKEGLLDDFKPQCKKCLKNAKECGGGFYDGIKDVFDEYFQ